MIAFLIFASVILLVLVLLLIPVSFTLEFNENFDYEFRYGFVRIPFLKGEKADKKTKENDNRFKKLFKEKGFVEAFKELCFYTKIFLEKLVYILKRINFKIVNLKITVGEKDAAKTAISYGVVSSAAYYVLGFLDSNANLKMKNVDVSADFNSGKTECEFKLKASLKPIFAIIAAFSLLKTIMELKNKELTYNERQ